MHWQFGEMKFGEMKRNPSNWSNFGMLLRRAGLTASAGLSCYPRDTMLLLARVIAIATQVCLSVTRRYCVKTKKASGIISSPSGSPKTLVFCRQISSQNSKGFPPNRGLKQGSVGKIQRFSSFKRQYLENGSRYGQSYY